MRKILPLYLFEDEKAKLEEIERKEADWRARLRARTLMMLSANGNAVEVAKVLKIHPKTVRQTRQRWEEKKFGMLHDADRSGAPKKLMEEERKRLCEWAREGATNSRDLLDRHLSEGGILVHYNTVINVLKEDGLVWKRTRLSLKKRRDETAFREAEQTLEVAREMAKEGELVMGYLDEAGFSCVPNNRNAWTPRGEQHMAEAVRGKRVNVLAALMSTGELPHVCFEETMASDIFVGFLADLVGKYEKPVLIVLDNASVHKAKKIKPHINFLKSKGIHLYFLPPYSPELNRIETFWRKVKYEWMNFKNRTTEILKSELNNILNNFGSKFKFSF